jgi:hypothetical protein
MNQGEMIVRGNKLAARYSIDELKEALKTALAINDHEERLVLQWALKTKTDQTDGYSFTEEQKESLKSKLFV